MNKTAIEWCDYTWNPVTGCKHGCPYCYARKIAERFKGSKAWPRGFEPMFHADRLNDPVKMKKPQSIFVCSMADLFGAWVPTLWQTEIFDACMKSPNHTYLFLTKNPIDIVAFDKDFPEYTRQNNHWFGVSVTGNETKHFISALQRVNVNRFVSFEPLLNSPRALDLTGIHQVIIGAQTNPDQYIGLEWVLDICEEADLVGAKVFMKDSIADRWQDRNLRRELAWRINK